MIVRNLQALTPPWWYSIMPSAIRRETRADRCPGDEGIAKLERFVEEHGLSGSGDSLCATLRQVQGARSRSSAHRKGSDFDEALLLDGAPDLPWLLETLLSSLATSFELLREDLAATSAS